MNVLAVGYDPTIDQTTKHALEEVIKAQPKWARVLPNLYQVVTPMKATEMRDALIRASSAKIVVYNVTNAGWGTNKVDSEVTTWIKNNWQQ